MKDLKVYRFVSHGNNAPAYGCNSPGDNSGMYYKKDDVDKLFANKAVEHGQALECMFSGCPEFKECKPHLNLTCYMPSNTQMQSKSFWVCNGCGSKQTTGLDQIRCLACERLR